MHSCLKARGKFEILYTFKVMTFSTLKISCTFLIFLRSPSEWKRCRKDVGSAQLKAHIGVCVCVCVCYNITRPVQRIMKKIIHIGLQQLTQKVIEIKSNLYLFYFLSESDLKMSHCSDVQISFFSAILPICIHFTFCIYIYFLILAVNAHLNMLA